MALTDFRDTNKSITIMRKGEDSSYKFQLLNADGSQFDPSLYSITSEGRFSELSEQPDFTFVVSTSIEDGLRYAEIFFDAVQLNSWIRQSKVYWKIYAATTATPVKTKVIRYGEIWLM